MKRILLALLAAGPHLLGAAPPELRGVWVDRAPLATRESIVAMLDTLRDARFNAVFVRVVARISALA